MNSPYMPISYQPFQMSQQQVPQYPNIQQFQERQQNNQNSIIWVQGEAGAKSFLVGPNQTVQLWDSEAQTIYLKSADASGMPSLKILDYTIRDEKTPSKNAQNRSDFDSFVTKDEFHSFEEKIQRKIEKLMKEDIDE